LVPAELQSALRQAVLELDIDRISALVEQVKVIDRELAVRLGTRADRFDYEGMAALLPGAAPDRTA
jgi:hypothetical protein